MPRLLKFVLVAMLLMTDIAMDAVADRVTTSWGGNAEMVYDTGFMHMLMRHPDGGVCLFNIDLIENDSPGAGISEKGVSSDKIWGKTQARKVLYLDDPRAEKAYLVAWYSQGKYPLRFSVNGKFTQVDNWDRKKCHLPYRWTEFPSEWLKKGKNIIEISCPEAQSQSEGWSIKIARADEFEHGGGDPKNVGKTSFKSTDGGESWKESPFGPLGQTRAEYTVRISFDRYVDTGWLATPIIDLWRGSNKDFIVPTRVFKKMNVSIRSEVPEGTTVEYHLRKGTSPNPFSKDWSQYELIGTGATVDLEFNDRIIDGRYIQLRAVLSTKNPLLSPVIKSVDITAQLMEGMPSHENVKTVKADNPVIKYSSIDWEWEKWDRPEFKELKTRENLDEVIAGSKTQFDAITKMLEYATVRVTRKYGDPYPHYPGWTGMSIAERIDKHGTIGMCIQFNNFLNGLCMTYGIQGRLINGMNHEMAEVWSDDFGKWVYLEASYGNQFLVDTETIKPMSLLEVHNSYLDYFFPDRPIDWMNEMTSSAYRAELIKERSDKPPVLRSSSTYHQNESLAYKGFIHSPFMRMVPRNNFYEKPYPMPLNHGMDWWPWNRYINWYDSRTPPNRQYTWFTDRPRDMWPDLNLVHVDATSAHSSKFLYLRFETYTPNFSHFEVDENDNGWKRVDSERWTWVLAPGKNTLRVRVVNKLGAQGKPSCFELYRAEVPLKDLF